MDEIIDKLLLLVSCTALYLFQDLSSFFIVPIILTIIASSLFSYYENYRLKLAGILLYSILSLIFPNFIAFLPVLLYDIMNSKYQFAILLAPFIYIYNFRHYNSLLTSFLFIFLVLAYLLKYKSDSMDRMRKEFNELRDSSSQISLRLKEKTQSLIQNQVNEINLATLNERNRISRELHDHIGHLLSRALLQVGALLTLTTDNKLKQGLTELKDSLSGGMDQIRSSIHNMYDDSIDLFQEINKLVKDFTFCPLEYSYDINNQPSLQLKISFIFIIKEALTNIMRHSNAGKAWIILREHPAMYQLIIQDNGTIHDKDHDRIKMQIENAGLREGMGLHNIAERVSSFGGILNISIDRGFRIFISIPKKEGGKAAGTAG